MSFTLMRYKDGFPAPIKMSIWDAFKGAPTPKPAKLKPVSPERPVIDQEPVVVASASPELDSQYLLVTVCPCCNKVHSQCKSEKTSKNDKRNDKDGKDGDQGNNKESAKDDKDGQSHSTRERESYSEEDDKKIIELKAAGKQWADILTATNKKSRSQLQDHWKKINPANPEGKGGQDGESKKDNTKDKTDAKKNQAQEKDKKKGKDTSGTAKKDAGNEKSEEGELELKSWSDRYDKQKWIAAASRHFDLTGQRITPAIAKKLAERR